METKTLSQTIKQRKHAYLLRNDDSGSAITITNHYTDDLAIMSAMRTLKKMKRNGSAPEHATLWLDLGQYGATQIQGFYRKD